MHARRGQRLRWRRATGRKSEKRSGKEPEVAQHASSQVSETEVDNCRLLSTLVNSDLIVVWFTFSAFFRRFRPDGRYTCCKFIQSAPPTHAERETGRINFPKCSRKKDPDVM